MTSRDNAPETFPEMQDQLAKSQDFSGRPIMGEEFFGNTAPLPAPARRTTRTVWAVLAIGVLGVGIVLWATYAHGAERPGKYEITLLYNGKDYDNVSRTFRTIGEPYETKTDCEVAITRVKVLVSGAKLRCDPVETGRVQ